jgi:putative ABC transport system permease protein
VYRVVLPGYFGTMGIPILHGRDVSERDVWDAPRAVVVNEQLARHFWPGQDAVGRRISLTGSIADPRWITIVGVAKDAKQDAWSATPENEVYLPYAQDPNYSRGSGNHLASATFVIRASGEPAALIPAARAAIWSIDRNLPVSEVQTMDAVVSSATAEPRFYLVVLASFAGVALLLAAIGIYGVMSYAVSRRRHEIGIRMALGARRGEVLRLVVRQGMSAVVIGGVVGLVAALLLTRLMTRLLWGVAATDPITFIAVVLVLALAALLASYVPARRAARIDPVVVLRMD